jgi:dTDP-4-amino-4,6-dideoxygalactose transaminase
MTDKLSKPIFVTQPALPPLEEYVEYLKQIWESKILTNNGPFHRQFERELSEYLNVNYVSLLANGTLGLVTALQVLRITGEVITTPFSFVATTHALWWNKIKPVFVDIEPESFNLDPEKVEAAITPQTTAIMPVHVYGNPCNVGRLQEIADIYGLKLIFDAAHAFGLRIKGQSVLNYGDLSVLSFHATKLFTTTEGGAIICHDKRTKKRIDYLKNFGFAGETTVVAPGINAKMNEMQAACGILQLKYVNKYIAMRKLVAEAYREGLKDIHGIKMLEEIHNVARSYPYFPILVNSDEFGRTRDDVYNSLKEHNIYGRRYFYPLISHFPAYRGLPSSRKENLPVAEKTAEQVICLPIYPDLNMNVLGNIVDILKSSQKKKNRRLKNTLQQHVA